VRRAAISEEEIQLRKRARRRLVGAVAIVVFVVAVVPMVLDHEPQPQSHEVELRIPSMSEEPVSNPGPEAVGSVEEAAQAPPPPSGLPAESLLGEPAAPKPAAAGQGGYVIQLIATRLPEKARTLTARMRENRIPAYTEPIPTPDGVRTRVRAGPFATEAEAQAARGRLRELNIMPPEADGKIVLQGQ
jgi:DedD protein